MILYLKVNDKVVIFVGYERVTMKIFMKLQNLTWQVNFTSGTFYEHIVLLHVVKFVLFLAIKHSSA